MNILKRVVLLFALLAVAVVDILIYWNSHLYYRVKEIEDSDILLRYIKVNVIDGGLNKKVRILHHLQWPNSYVSVLSLFQAYCRHRQVTKGLISRGGSRR